MVFRSTVDGLIESLEAVIRLSRWNGTEPKPEPLVTSASKLLERLGAADRLSAAKFQGPATDVVKVNAICEAMKRLDAAYLVYRQQTEATTPSARGNPLEATMALETEVAATTAGAATWR